MFFFVCVSGWYIYAILKYSVFTSCSVTLLMRLRISREPFLSLPKASTLYVLCGGFVSALGGEFVDCVSLAFSSGVGTCGEG